jgi:hypothetical protein
MLLKHAAFDASKMVGGTGCKDFTATKHSNFSNQAYLQQPEKYMLTSEHLSVTTLIGLTHNL